MSCYFCSDLHSVACECESSCLGAVGVGCVGALIANVLVPMVVDITVHNKSNSPLQPGPPLTVLFCKDIVYRPLVTELFPWVLALEGQEVLTTRCRFRSSG